MINPEWLKLYKGMVLLQTLVVLGHNVMKALFDQMDNFSPDYLILPIQHDR